MTKFNNGRTIEPGKYEHKERGSGPASTSHRYPPQGIKSRISIVSRDPLHHKRHTGGKGDKMDRQNTNSAEDRLAVMMKADSYTKAAPGGKYAAELEALLAKYRGDDTRLALAAFQMGYECKRMEQKGGNA